jgi:hypothetical protein
MATSGSGPPSASESKEDQIVVSVTVGGSPPADGRDMGATTGASDTAGTQEAQKAAAAALREEEARMRANMETSRLYQSTGDTSARQEMIRSIRERRAAEEAKIDADRHELAELIEGGSEYLSPGQIRRIVQCLEGTSEEPLPMLQGLDREIGQLVRDNQEAEPSAISEATEEAVRTIVAQATRSKELARQEGQLVGRATYLDCTFKEYPSFKRKFRTYQANYHQATPQREQAQMFRENCLPDKIAIHIKKAEDMLKAWRILDAIYDNPLAFIKDLMQEIRAVPEFREEDCEKMMEYYMLLQPHIAEADIPASIADMTRILPYAEGKRWRDQLGRIHPLDIGNGFSTFVDRRLEYATTQVANCERLVLPKPIPLGARANRSPSTDRHGSRGDRGGSVSRGNSASRGARLMGISAERKPAQERRCAFRLPGTSTQMDHGGSHVWPGVVARRDILPRSAKSSRR